MAKKRAARTPELPGLDGEPVAVALCSPPAPAPVESADPPRVKRLVAYRFRLKTTPRVEALFARYAGCCRYVYNRALAEQERRYAAGEKRLGYASMCKLLTKWKRQPELGWLTEAPNSSLQQSLKNLVGGYAMFFAGHAKSPRFKKKGRAVDSFRYPDPAKFEVDTARGRLKLPKVGWIRYFNSRLVVGALRQIIVSCRAGRWFASVRVEQEVPEPVHPHLDSAVGVDLGVVRFATLSDGRAVPPLNAFAGIRVRLTRLQRMFARQVRFSGRWKRTKAKIAKLYGKAADRRLDFLHKLSHDLTKNQGTVVVEDLRVEAMSASSRGTVETPGKNVRQKAGLNRSIQDQGWGEFLRQLQYKAAWRGGRVIKVPAANTSRMCAECGHIAADNRQSQSVFKCVQCGHSANADDNAARNVLAAGQAVIARGGMGLSHAYDAGITQLSRVNVNEAHIRSVPAHTPLAEGDPSTAPVAAAKRIAAHAAKRAARAGFPVEAVTPAAPKAPPPPRASGAGPTGPPPAEG